MSAGHKMRALANTRRDICLHRCPLAERCAAWNTMAADPAAHCPAGMWHEAHYNAQRRGVAPPPAKTRRARRPPGASRSPGPGTILKRMLARLGIKAAASCGCNRRAAEMDQRGVAWCAANVSTIVAWMGEEAGKQKMPFSPLGARVLVWLAIARARMAFRKVRLRGN